MSPVNGKRILLVAPAYFGYEKFLIDGLTALGATVRYVENRAFQNDPANHGTKWYQRFFCKKQRYINNTLIPVSREKFDLCLFINLFSFHPVLVKNIRQQNPEARCILYLWDNLRGYKWAPFLRHFDKVFSFDPVESGTYGLNYLPNFYPDVAVEKNEEAPGYELCFIGSFQVHRLTILERLATLFNEQNRPYFFYLYLSPHYNNLKYNTYVNRVLQLFAGRFEGYKALYKLISGRKKHALVYHDRLPPGEAFRRMARSKCILDLPYPDQTGSTQRVIQALALNKKVITTNGSVIHEFFYRPEQISVVSPGDFYVDETWLKEEIFSELSVDRLRLDNWLTYLLA